MLELAGNHVEVLAAAGFHLHEATRVKTEDVADLTKIVDYRPNTDLRWSFSLRVILGLNAGAPATIAVE